MVNPIGSSSPSSGEVIVDNEDPVVRLDTAKIDPIQKDAKDKDGKPIIDGSGNIVKETVGQKITVTFAAFDNSFDNSIKEGITVSMARLDSPKSAVKTQEIKDKGIKTFEVTINDPNAKITDYAIYGQDKAGNIGQINLKEQASATNTSTIALAIRIDQEGVDLVKSRLVGRTKYMAKDLTKVSDNYEVTIGTVKYALQEDSLRSLGVSPSIDAFMNALMQAKEWDSNTNKPKENGSQLSSKVSIYKVNDVIYIEGNDKELIKINDKTKIGTDTAIVSNMIGLNPDEGNTGVDSEKQQYVITVTGEDKNKGKLIICLAGKCFNIDIVANEGAESIATKIATAINNNRILDGYESATATGNTIKVIRNYGGAVIPTFTVESFNYDN